MIIKGLHPFCLLGYTKQMKEGYTMNTLRKFVIVSFAIVKLFFIPSVAAALLTKNKTFNHCLNALFKFEFEE